MTRKNPVMAILLLLAFSLVCLAQSTTVDDDFAPALSKSPSAVFLTHYFQPDGKIIVTGTFNVVNGQIRYFIARLNTDGTIDPTFNCTACATFNVLGSVIQPDGKIIVSGQNNIIRVNSDGSLDSSFNYPVIGLRSFFAKAVQSDGKILVIEGTVGIGGGGNFLIRLNPDGSKDTDFSSAGASNFSNQKLDVKILADGRIFVFGDNSFGYLAQINQDGSKSNSFDSPALSITTSGRPAITDITLQADGKIALIGRFDVINGINRNNLARLNTNQSVDTSFNPPQYFTQGGGDGQIFALSNNKLLIGSNALPASPGKVLRLNDDGSLDNTFTPPNNISAFLSMQVDSSERIYVFGSILISNRLARYNADGTYDPSFNPAIEFAGTVLGLGLQSDGKVLVGGSYEKANGFNRKLVSRINPDGTTDTGFDTAEKFTAGNVNDFAVQPDGNILVAGGYTYDGSAKSLVRLNPNGSLDPTFNANITGNSGGPTTIFDVALQSDGKIIIGGTIKNVDGTSRNAVARLNSNGTLDTTFNVILSTTATIYVVAIQSDGKILIGGTFSGVNGFNRSNMARLNSDGTLDTSFDPAVGSLRNIIILPGGKYMTSSLQRVSRLNSDGSNDSSFQFPILNNGSSSSVTDFAVLDDGSIIVSGDFNALNGLPFRNIARLRSDGTPVLNSFPKGVDSPPSVFLKQPDGKLLAGGDFKLIENKPRTGLARLVFSAIVNPTPFDFDGDGRADIGVYRPSSAVWYQLIGANYQFSQRTFGEPNIKIVPADYDGDGRTDYGIWKPSTAEWIFINSSNGAMTTRVWGAPGDIPLPSDVDDDGKAELVIYRPSNSTWYRLRLTGGFTEIKFGSPNDKPVIGDFDGDGKADPAIYRPSTGTWWYAASSAGNAFRAVQWGIAEDIPVAADYDGDGLTDYAVYRPSNGVWYILNTGSGTATIIQFGLMNDKPIAADYDGDGKADIAVYRPSTGEWYLLRTTAGFTGLQFGISEDIPIPNAFVP